MMKNLKINSTIDFSIFGTEITYNDAEIKNYKYDIKNSNDWYEKLTDIACFLLKINEDELTQEMLQNINKEDFNIIAYRLFKNDAKKLKKHLTNKK